MWRTRAVRSLLVEEVAGLRPEAGGEDAGSEVGGAHDGGEAGPGPEAQALRRARRRARLVVGLDWAAILTLVLLHDRPVPILDLGPGEQAIFTLAILAIAVHSGFRLGQLEKYEAVSRACRELEEREPG